MSIKMKKKTLPWQTCSTRDVSLRGKVLNRTQKIWSGICPCHPGIVTVDQHGSWGLKPFTTFETILAHDILDSSQITFYNCVAKICIDCNFCFQSNPYALKDAGSAAADMSAWTSAGLQPTTGYYPYDPTLAAYG